MKVCTLGLILILYQCHRGCGKSLLANLMQQAKTLQHGLELADTVGNLGSIHGNGVGFHAFPSGSRYYGSGTTIYFDRTRVNQGSAFNTKTYKFTCPYRGLYAFSWSLKTHHGLYSYTSLVRNGAKYQSASCSSTSSRSQTYFCTQSAVMWLNRGDTVWIKSDYSNSYIYGAESTFTGWKI